MDTLRQDLRYAARTLLKNPGFAALTIVCLALGIGVNSTIFSVVDTVAIRPLPFRQPERLVSLHTTHQVGTAVKIFCVVLPAAVIFDFDGVILDSETPEFESHRRVFEQCGVELTRDEWCGQIGTWTEGLGDRWHATLCQRSSRPLDREAFEREQRRICQEIVPREPMRGILELLRALAEAGVPRAIASSGPAHWIVPAIDQLELTSFFDAIVTGDDVANRKPSPEAYLEAARRLAADPTRSIAVEDSAPGVAAARAAGMKTVAIPHLLTEGHDLSGADLRVSHAGELTVARLATLLG